MTTAAKTIEALRQAVALQEINHDYVGFESDVFSVMAKHDKGSETGEGPIHEMICLSLDRYLARKPIQISGTLRLILEGDLGAITSADSQTFGSIKTIYRWCHMELPSQSWGSREKVAAWTKGSRN